MLRITNFKINIDQITDFEQEKILIKNTILSKLRLKHEELLDFKIYKKSIDARKKEEIFFTYTLDLHVKNERKIFQKLKNRHKNITIAFEPPNIVLNPGTKKLKNRPIIVGSGPAGLFSALTLARQGYKPLLLERGEDVDARTKKVQEFWRIGNLDPESNVQFGEGGAGTFSDGKLTTLINDKRSRVILEELIEAGAPKEILYTNKAHIGTDLLKKIVKQIRNEIISCGGDVRFNAKMTDLLIENNKLRALVINGQERIDCEIALLGIGHSARDTFEILQQRGLKINPKPFSLGVRIEHPQSMINKAQFGRYALHPLLGAADYKLVYHAPSGRSAYTFCMCPGGYVVAAASEKSRIVTNGMSEYRRDGLNANAAILVGVTPTDFGSNDPLAGVKFQRKWESLAYQLAGNSYQAPAQLVGDFLADRPSTTIGNVIPTYKPGITLTELKKCLPDFVTETLKEALLYFEHQITGFARSDAILTGVETRSSSPIRIKRNEDYEANITGIYPMGEGAGYAGGIMSSALDGLKVAEGIISNFAPLA